MASEKTTLLAGLDEAFDGGSWHGPSLRGALRGLDVATATYRPGLGRHDIWELVLHIAYWKLVVRRRLTGDKTVRFAYGGKSFFPTPANPTPPELKRDVALLVDEHRKLR